MDVRMVIFALKCLLWQPWICEMLTYILVVLYAVIDVSYLFFSYEQEEEFHRPPSKFEIEYVWTHGWVSVADKTRSLASGRGRASPQKESKYVGCVASSEDETPLLVRCHCRTWRTNAAVIHQTPTMTSHHPPTLQQMAVQNEQLKESLAKEDWDGLCWCGAARIRILNVLLDRPKHGRGQKDRWGIASLLEN